MYHIQDDAFLPEFFFGAFDTTAKEMFTLLVTETGGDSNLLSNTIDRFVTNKDLLVPLIHQYGLL